MKNSPFFSTKAESSYHKTIKLMIYKFISENSPNILKCSLEENLGHRRADVYFKFKNGKEVVVEIQHSRISVKEIIKRTREYNQMGIYILWIIHGNGSCVASPKYLMDKERVRISLVEQYLHNIYGGRGYYVAIEDEKNTITPPFALHFSVTSKKNYKKPIRGRNETFFIRNVNFSKIPNWNLLCTEYKGLLIARFYDKNVDRVLKEEISKIIKESAIKMCENCKYPFKIFNKCKFSPNCRFKPPSKKKLFRILKRSLGSKYSKTYIHHIMSQIIENL